jgi:hypothetical protein
MSESSWGKPEDWSKVITGVGEGASSAIQGAADSKTAKRLAKETKRRTLANLLSQTLKRKQGLFKREQEHGEEMSDIKSEAMQNAAHGLVESLRGSTKRSRSM